MGMPASVRSPQHFHRHWKIESQAVEKQTHYRYIQITRRLDHVHHGRSVAIFAPNCPDVLNNFFVPGYRL
jgi:hypothetical protein